MRRRLVPCLGRARADGVLTRNEHGRTRAILLHLGNEDPRGQVGAPDVDVEETVKLLDGHVQTRLVGVGPSGVVNDSRGGFSKLCDGGIEL